MTDFDTLAEIERKILWLSTWMIHHANHIRPNIDGLKVGGHQASSASLVSLMTALYFATLRPEDRVAVKPHASPVLHAIEYLFGRQTEDQLKYFRALGGAQAYPSRTKDKIRVDFSTGSVGLGAAITNFASLVQSYVHLKGLTSPESKLGRMIALVGDAELDEGNIFEALLESWKHDIRNVWWIIDYNRQSLDAVVEDRLIGKFDALFRSVGWEVITLKYGKKLQSAFQTKDGEALREWIDNCPNSLYSALTFKGGRAWREALERDLGGKAGIRKLLSVHDDAQLSDLMTNLAGHDLETLVEAFRSVNDDAPRCFIAYTIKGYGLPLAGHKDNHAGLLNKEQIEALRQRHGVREGEEWNVHAGVRIPAESFERVIRQAPFIQDCVSIAGSVAISVPESLPVEISGKMSTQEGFGKILGNIAREKSELAARIVTTAPDVSVSTNLGAWVNRRGIFDTRTRADVFKSEKVVSTQTWSMSPDGQHIELGIAENNLFLMLSALGLAEPLFGTRLLPIGTLYDPFIQRGLDALNYACYQDARFMLVATPSGLTLAPEGGAHQSIATPLIGIGQPGLSYFEPAYVDELAVLMAWGFRHMQRPSGGSIYLRLSTRLLEQPQREVPPSLARNIEQGAYWYRMPGKRPELVIAYCGAVAPEVLTAVELIKDELPEMGVLAVTSPDVLYRGWSSSREGLGAPVSHIEQLLAGCPRDTALVTVIDGHPATLSWLGSVGPHRIRPMGVSKFGQSGSIPELYKAYRLDAASIINSCADALAEKCVA